MNLCIDNNKFGRSTEVIKKRKSRIIKSGRSTRSTVRNKKFRKSKKSRYSSTSLLKSMPGTSMTTHPYSSYIQNSQKSKFKTCRSEASLHRTSSAKKVDISHQTFEKDKSRIQSLLDR